MDFVTKQGNQDCKKILNVFLLFQVVEMDPTDNQDELMHELIRGSTRYIAPEFDEDENDGSQFLNLHYHGCEEQDIIGRKKKMSRKPRYKSLVILSGIRINVLSIYMLGARYCL